MTAVAAQPLHRALGLTDWEFDRIQALLARSPNDFELAVFSVLWSEHCGYKHSALLLGRLPSSGARVLQGPGENAGVVDLGEGLAVAFKVESHNHPSAVEPFQGAATGVGGIIRDIIAMGARPIALLDGLRFGSPDWHFRRAVAGIGHYGNCLAGDERLLFRNGSTVRATTIGAIVESRSNETDAESFTCEPSKPFEVLSVDPETLEAQWRPVRRILKRRATRLLRIRARLGRELTVTEDHPVMVVVGEHLEQKPARNVAPGDRIPLLCALPIIESSEDSIDLLQRVEDDGLIVQLPDGWTPSAALRVALRAVLTSADSRCYWLRRGELPRPAYLAVEDLIDVDRGQLRLRLPGPRSTSVPALFPLDLRSALLLGYYLAEGCCSKNGSTAKIIWTFSRNASDDSYVHDVCDILNDWGVRHNLEERAATRAITVSSRIWASLLRDILECGSKSYEKRVPHEFFVRPDLRWETMRGIFRGDGSAQLRPNGGSPARISHSTTSAALHDQLLLALQAVGIVPSRHTRSERSGSINGRPVRGRQAYALEINRSEDIQRAADLFPPRMRDRLLVAVAPAVGSPYSNRIATQHGQVASVAVTSIEPVNVDAPVYDLEVPGSHLFVTSGGIVTHNCTGIPNVGGETVFDDAYAANPLVNAMCVGLLPTERVLSAHATGPGNLVVLYGAFTGRDGIGGASVLASQDLAGSDEKRPSVQIGDPFRGKALIEVSLELVERDLVISLQDCGAAGLSSSLAEMAREVGVDVHLDRVPLREPDLEPWEIMISESQERMVAVVAPERFDEVRAVCERWELPCTPIGEVTAHGELRAFSHDEIVGTIPARLLTDECPRYEVGQAPQSIPPARPAPAEESKTWIFEQYDQLVGSRTVRRPGLDAGVLRIDGTRGIAVSLDGPPVGERDPFRAGYTATMEAAMNVACAGGEPLALTDCLNFGNPERPAIGWELAQAIDGIAQAANELGIPVVSGNVSLYNEAGGKPIPPTPVVGCLGLVRDVTRIPNRWRRGDRVFFLRGAGAELVGHVWSNAESFSLATDGSVEDASAWSGIDAGFTTPEGPGVIVACAKAPEWPDTVELGTV